MYINRAERERESKKEIQKSLSPLKKKEEILGLEKLTRRLSFRLGS
jgi:hypothetical protein